MWAHVSLLWVCSSAVEGQGWRNLPHVSGGYSRRHQNLQIVTGMSSVNFIQLNQWSSTKPELCHLSVLAIMANFDLAVMISLKSQNNFKHWSYQDEAKAIQSCKKKFHKCKQAISSEPSIKISPPASRGSFCTNNLASSVHCNVHICTFVIFMEINVLTNVKWALWQNSFSDLPTQKWRPIQCLSRYLIILLDTVNEPFRHIIMSHH